MFLKKLYTFGDRFEDVARSKLSRVPIFYAALGGTGIILFWRGIWHTMDYLMEYFFLVHDGSTSKSAAGLPWWDGPLSIVIGASLLLAIGLFVTSFIGDAIIVSGLKSEKKLTEKTEEEVLAELRISELVHTELHDIDRRVKSIETSLRTGIKSTKQRSRKGSREMARNRKTSSTVL